MRIIQITDCHLRADPDARCRTGVAYRQLEAVVASARQLNPDLVVLSGDISEDNSVESYVLAEQAMSRLGCPWYWLAGNHDAPAIMASLRPMPEALDAGGWRLLLADTHWPGHARGQLGDDGLAALARALDAHNNQPTLIFMHHPPMDVGSAWMDALGLSDSQALCDLLGGRSQVRGIVCGHIHQAFVGQLATRTGEVPVYGTPSTSDQFLPGSVEFAVDRVAQPGFRVIELNEDAFSSWIERVSLLS
ncbi:MAG: metallophosphoesterase [Halomonas sp.]|uniref:metallophosphoesterase n=1 Tax=Halomonas sp. TaxID=1486246 RepID=UPI003F938106